MLTAVEKQRVPKANVGFGRHEEEEGAEKVSREKKGKKEEAGDRNRQ